VYTTPVPEPEPEYTTNKYGSVVEMGEYISYPGPLNSQSYCPWNAGTYNNNAYSGDCKNGKCNLKYVGRCLNNLFNKVYKDICKWQEAAKLQKDINGFLVALGVSVEKKWNIKCGLNVSKYTSGSRTMYYPPEYDYDLAPYTVGELEDDSDYDYEGSRRRRADIREVAKCKDKAGLIDCNLINFHNVQDELGFYNKIEKLVKHVGTNCNSEWNNHMNSFLQRFKNSLTCPGGFPDHS